MAGRGGGDASAGLLPGLRAAGPPASGPLSDSDSDDEAGPEMTPWLEPPCPEEASDAEAEAEEEAEAEAEAPPPPGPLVLPFRLRGTSPTFSLRSRSIFAGLEGAAPRPPAPPRPPAAPAAPAPEPFKRPLAPPPPPAARAPVPDYVTHPERWTRYSLEDVPEGSDQSNRAAALGFLEDLRRRAAGPGPGPDACAPSFNQDPSSRGAGRIVFTKPAKAAEARPERRRRPGEELVALGHLGSPGAPDGDGPDGEAQAEEPAEASPPDAGPTGALGFHGSKKRSREHLRAKGPGEEDREEA